MPRRARSTRSGGSRARSDRAQGERHEHHAQEREHGELPRERLGPRGAEIDGAAHADVVRGGEDLGEPAEDERHVAGREREAGELDERDAEQHRLLHRLGGRARGGREVEAEGERREDVARGDGDEEKRVPLRPDPEHEAGDQHHDDDVEREHRPEREELPEQDLGRGRRRHLELVEGAGQALVHDRDGGDDRGQEGEHEAEGAGHHEGLALEAWVEERARDHLDPARRRRGGRGEAGAAAREEAPDERFGVAGERRLAPVVDHLHLGRLAAVQVAVEVGRDDERDADRARDQRVLEGAARRVRARVEGPARAEVRDQAAAGRRRARVVHAERQVLHVGREHEPEEDQGDERHGDEDGHREGVAQGGTFAANLTRVGEKGNYDYLVRWVHNPRERTRPYCPFEKKDIGPEDYKKKGLPYVFDLDHSRCPNDGHELQVQNMTVMPSLRLSPQDAADVASYLITLKKQEPSSYADAPFMDDPKLKDAGKKWIRHFGCAGCHEISGLEDEGRIGTELTTEGSKPIERLDFALLTEMAQRGDG